jgi:hypothetical protein
MSYSFFRGDFRIPVLWSKSSKMGCGRALQGLIPSPGFRSFQPSQTSKVTCQEDKQRCRQSNSSRTNLLRPRDTAILQPKGSSAKKHFFQHCRHVFYDLKDAGCVNRSRSLHNGGNGHRLRILHTMRLQEADDAGCVLHLKCKTSDAESRYFTKRKRQQKKSQVALHELKNSTTEQSYA